MLFVSEMRCIFFLSAVNVVCQRNALYFLSERIECCLSAKCVVFSVWAQWMLFVSHKGNLFNLISPAWVLKWGLVRWASRDSKCASPEYKTTPTFSFSWSRPKSLLLAVRFSAINIPRALGLDHVCLKQWQWRTSGKVKTQCIFYFR